jgi:non-heme chloroperoxidase
MRPLWVLVLLIMANLGCASMPHRAREPTSSFVTGAGEIRLHYLDFGGTGEPVLLLPGAGNTAWIYSDFAPRLARDHHVLALTRRGHGESDMPETGYDQATLVDDIRLFLDAGGLRRVHLIGHSAAGGELTLFATLHPERVISLVYLDAAYDRYAQGAVERGNPERPPAPVADDRTSMETFTAYLFRTRPIYALYPRHVVERDTLASLAVQSPGEVGFRMGQTQFGEMLASLSASPPDYSRMQAPALAVYAAGQSAFRLSTTPPERKPSLARFLNETVEPWRRASMEQFRRGAARGEVIEMDAVHHLFLHKPDETADLVRAFLSRHRGNRRP